MWQVYVWLACFYAFLLHLGFQQGRRFCLLTVTACHCFLTDRACCITVETGGSLNAVYYFLSSHLEILLCPQKGGLLWP
ncbi:hypothetical protein ASPFODRAFT_39609 [Aspergillus luchuensis CBS 106.47]|uniref:Secreted protein n=1 Tax=Aspergillus luchuensis (strain CBS 106.47) TaxID=1137211 RepID=A0A1M3TZS8_ASPLC|nr:hypothetical protein ASPFODRAFT_39609 [Aspergillus luchuensis CBS 106.47]